MKEKHFKLIMELIFIFIIPLVILCINCNYQNTIEYDNNGNYQATEKHIEFNAPFTYTKTETNQSLNLLIFPSNDSILTGDFYLKVSDIENGYYTLYYNDLGKEVFIIQFRETYINYFDEVSSESFTFNILDTITINEENYYKFNWNNTQFKYYNDGDILQNNGYYQYINETTINTIWGNLKNLIIDNLQIQDNQIVDIIITYTILWFIHFVIWHFFYLFFDGLVHLFIEWKKRSD